MLHVKAHTNNNYEILNGKSIGTIHTSYNPFHLNHCYVDFQLKHFDIDSANTVCQELARYIQEPMQIITNATNTQLIAFLRAANFQLKRKTTVVECSKEERVYQRTATIPLQRCNRTDDSFKACATLVYTHYEKTHRAVSPLTASFEAFCKGLPDTALYYRNGAVTHTAFIEHNEIAYIASSKETDIDRFLSSVIDRLFADFHTISFEADNTDPIAMKLLSLFNPTEEELFYTFIRD